MNNLNAIRKAIVGLVVPIVTYLVAVGILPEPPDGQSVEAVVLAITGAITALFVWLVPNKESTGITLERGPKK